MPILDTLHQRWIYQRRIKRLSQLLAEQLEEGYQVLDVGCGDGVIANHIKASKHIEIQGVDVLERDSCAIPFKLYDGKKLPFEDNSFDVVQIVDVLHHVDDIEACFKELCRVTKKYLLIKDHCRDGILARKTLEFMDNVGNKRYGVNLPYNYLSKEEWNQLLNLYNCQKQSWNSSLSLYPFPLSLFFDRQLHFISLLEVK